MNSLYNQYSHLSQASLNLHFTKACIEADLEKIKYLLTSPELSVHADIRTRNNQGLISACCGGYVDVVEYLLTSKELKEKADVYAQESYCFSEAGSRGDTRLVKILLDACQGQNNPHNHELSLEIVFETACHANHLHLIELLVLEYGVKKEKAIKHIFDSLIYVKSQEYIDSINSIFQKVELNKILEKDLNIPQKTLRHHKL